MFFDNVDYDKIPQLTKHMESFFRVNSNISKNAYLNWRMVRQGDWGSEFLVLAEGYFDSAYHLLDICIKDNSDKKADIIIFPILFNIVHGIELSLKAINCYLNMILEDGYEQRIEGGHNIKQLSDDAIKHLRDLKSKGDVEDIGFAITAMKLVKKFIDNIYKQSNDMAFTRYPINAKKQDMFYTAAIKNITVDMEVLREQMVYVCNMLDCIIGILMRHWEYLCEIRQLEDEFRHECEMEMRRAFEDEMRQLMPSDY